MAPLALLTDFGLGDPYAGILRGVLATLAPGVPVLDVTHGVPPQDVRVGALFLDAAWPHFPVGTVFVCVVDPGVGTARRPIAVRAAGRLFVGPDNGLLGLLPDPEARAITAPWGVPSPSRTFHGRDLFAPVAARLATGAAFSDVGPIVTDAVRMTLPAADDGAGEVLYVDHFGNAVTNLPGVDHGVVRIGDRPAPVVPTYGAAPRGVPVALTGSTGRVEIALRDGNAAHTLGIGPGTRVTWEPA
ncbi:MAG: SAM-dependent chlorinase/fluorinase [Pseudomonadota bacterium]|nr:SAM-dependent chlorinase/fluorinase [Pseudomonadota bacterium]